uniref:AP2/ERF domain-containing protein n=1 Tax=Chloropicon primus TaxID=1764295 RepID=A0A7S2T737_9CHLO|mmetsp:Transcript_878/g.2607  ORF Transcript_878/g.2607 Transcript_878/m.2607 type:complete len:250 (+) Transcript_878:163-912(+)
MDGIGLDWILLDPPYPVAFYPIEPSVMEVPSDPVGVPRGGTNAGTIATEPEGPLQRLNRLKKSTNSPEKVEEDARADHGARRPLQGQRRGRGARNEGTRRSTRRRKIAKSSDRGGQANEKGGTTRELRGISAHRNTGKWESHLWNPKVKRKGGRRKTGVQVYVSARLNVAVSTLSRPHCKQTDHCIASSNPFSRGTAGPGKNSRPRAHGLGADCTDLLSLSNFLCIALPCIGCSSRHGRRPRALTTGQS